MFKRYQQIHFVGIGGVGMSGIAEVLLNLGYRVHRLGRAARRDAWSGSSASAPRSSPATRRRHVEGAARRRVLVRGARATTSRCRRRASAASR